MDAVLNQGVLYSNAICPTPPPTHTGFIGYIVAPSFDVCAAVFDVISELPLPLDNIVSHGNQSQQREWPWTENMDNNKVMWQKKKGL